MVPESDIFSNVRRPRGRPRKVPTQPAPSPAAEQENVGGPAWISPQAWAVRYGLSRSTLYELLRDRKIEGRKCGNRTIINVGSTEKYLAALPLVGESQK